MHFKAASLQLLYQHRNQARCMVLATLRIWSWKKEKYRCVPNAGVRPQHSLLTSENPTPQPFRQMACLFRRV
jgi:hypothetical protein